MSKTTSARRDKARKWLFGTADRRSRPLSAFLYLTLTAIAFIYLYPVLYMLSRSLMSSSDLLDASAKWIPSAITLGNYRSAITTMDYWRSLLKNLYIALASTLCQVTVCSMVGYGMARYRFPLRRAWMGVLLLSFLLPSQTTMLPNYLLFSRLKLANGTVTPFVVTAILGMGFKSPLFILIFYNFHRQVPGTLIEAAEIDGAGQMRAYFGIAVPLAVPAIVAVTLFSFVWYWNENYLINVYLGVGNAANAHGSGLTTLMLELKRFEDSYEVAFPARTSSATSPNRLNDAIRMAGTMLSIAPLLILYLFLQKRFVESVDKAGITGE